MSGNLESIDPAYFIEKRRIIEEQFHKINTIIGDLLENGELDNRFDILIDTLMTISKNYINIYIKDLDDDQRRLYLETVAALFLDSRKDGY